jgi:hypothetical protein
MGQMTQFILHESHIYEWLALHDGRQHCAHYDAWVRHHASLLTRKPAHNGYKAVALHRYTDTHGNPTHWRIRMKRPDTGEKWIRPMCRTMQGFDLKQPDYPEGSPLYYLHELVVRPDAPVWIVEGESCADSLVNLGVLATTSGGADSAARADWSVIAGREVTIWPDNDEAGRRYAEAVADILHGLGCAVSILDTQTLDLPAKGDVVDWLAAHPGATAEEVAKLPRLIIEGKENDPSESSTSDDLDTAEGLHHADDSEGKERESQASLLVKFAQERVELFHDANKNVYARDLSNGEVRRIDGRAFRDWLTARFFEHAAKSARDQAVREAISTMSGIGRFSGECRTVNIRVAQHQDGYLLDLAEPGKNRAVRISPGSWDVLEEAPAMFIRPESMHALPEPTQAGTLDALWCMANVPEQSRLLVLTWLIECLRLDTPFPVLELIGEQGSAKSTTQAILRRMIDPNACDLRAAPRNQEDVFIGAGVNWLVSYENISHLHAPMQDAFCVLSTGGGFAKRKLYSDADEAVIQVKRPVAMNGIAVAITAQDLVDRTITVETSVITERAEVTDIWRQFKEQHPRLLGALLNVFAETLRLLPTVNLPPDRRPRLAEFARLGMAVALATGHKAERFMKEFEAARAEAIARTIDSSPVATAIIEWFEARKCQPREDTVGVLFKEVEYFRPSGTDAWPKSAKGFGDALRRAAPALRTLEIECKSLGKQGGSVKWRISPQRKSPEPSPESPASPDPDAWQDFRTSRTLNQKVSLPGKADDDVEVF